MDVNARTAAAGRGIGRRRAEPTPVARQEIASRLVGRSRAVRCLRQRIEGMASLYLFLTVLAVTSLLFSTGKGLIGLYLGRSAIASTYGAAGTLAILLVWVYYSAQIVLLGAEFTQVYSRRFGARIVPAPHAVPEVRTAP